MKQQNIPQRYHNIFKLLFFDLISITVQLKPSRYLQANVYSRKHVTGIVYNVETRPKYIFHKKYYSAIPKEQIS